MDIGIEAPEPFADLRRFPGRPVPLEAYDQRLDLDRELAGMAIRPA